MKKIKIIDCGPSLKAVSKEFGQSPEWIMSCLGKNNYEFEWIKKYSGKNTCGVEGDAWIITGSPRSVYEEDDWMLDLEKDIRRISDKKIPILGICFGHQLIAKSFGGSVVLNPKGWELGSYPIQFTKEGLKSSLFKKMDQDTIVYESHKDCVVNLPKNAIKLAFNKKCVQAFMINKSVYAVQFHPEFSLEIMKKYVSVRSTSEVTIEDPQLPESKQGHFVLKNFIKMI